MYTLCTLTWKSPVWLTVNVFQSVINTIKHPNPIRVNSAVSKPACDSLPMHRFFHWHFWNIFMPFWFLYSCTVQMLQAKQKTPVSLTLYRKTSGKALCQNRQLTCLWGPLRMCARAPSHAVLMASIEGVPNRSVIKSSYKPTTHITDNRPQ